MKLLMFFAPSFSYTPFRKTLPSVPDMSDRTGRSQTVFSNAVVAFYQCEAGDEVRRAKVLTKLLKNLKWLAGKFDTRTVVLHSFGHLSTSKADPEFTRELAADALRSLRDTGYDVAETPFGYLNEWIMHVAGESLAKVFKDI